MNNNIEILRAMFNLMLDNNGNVDQYKSLSNEAYARLNHSYADDDSLEDARFETV